MKAAETLEDFYRDRLHAIPHHLKNEIGHFNVFTYEDLAGCKVKTLPFNRRAYFKISLVFGQNQVYFSDKSYEIKKQAIVFANSKVPYSWEKSGHEQFGYFCVFTSRFFHHFGNPEDYSVFQPDGIPVIELTDEQAAAARGIFEEMHADWASVYPHKYDRMRVLVFELLQKAVKLQPVHAAPKAPAKASRKIAAEFLEFLERQFPVEEKGQSLRLRSSSDFADQLSVHVNHLNKALKQTLQKSTSALIQERLLLEAKVLLKHSHKDVSEIALLLGFKERTHFNNFFKKHTLKSPSQFRTL